MVHDVAPCFNIRVTSDVRLCLEWFWKAFTALFFVVEARRVSIFSTGSMHHVCLHKFEEFQLQGRVRELSGDNSIHLFRS